MHEEPSVAPDVYSYQVFTLVRDKALHKVSEAWQIDSVYFLDKKFTPALSIMFVCNV
jgi:hypothetical protein